MSCKEEIDSDLLSFLLVGLMDLGNSVLVFQMIVLLSNSHPSEHLSVLDF